MKANTTVTNILLAAIAVLLGAGIFVAAQKADEYLKYKAIDDCGRISRYEAKVGESATVWYPDAGVYKSCLDDKGIE